MYAGQCNDPYRTGGDGFQNILNCDALFRKRFISDRLKFLSAVTITTEFAGTRRVARYTEQ